MQWRRGRKWEWIKLNAHGKPQTIPAGSHAEFITEHYWGYTRFRGGCSEYRVEHPRWKVWNAESFEFSALPEEAMREIRERITTRVRFNAVVETGVPGFIPRAK